MIEPQDTELALRERRIRALIEAAQEHGQCTCGPDGPRPIGEGRFYHYTFCDFDHGLLVALKDLE